MKKYQGKYYQVDLVRVRWMETLRVVMKRLRTKHFDFHFENRVDLRLYSHMIFLRKCDEKVECRSLIEFL